MIKKYSMFFVLFIVSYTLSQDELVGIENAGSTCFMNAAMQCLYHSLDITNYLKKLPADYYKEGSAAQTYLNFLTIYQQHAKKGATIGSEIAKINWCVNLTKLFPLSSAEKEAGLTEKPFGYTQDASELMIQLLQHLIKDDISEKYLTSIPNFPFPLRTLPRNKLTDLLVTIILESKYRHMSEEAPLARSLEQSVLPISIVKDFAEDTPSSRDTVKIFANLDSALANAFNKKTHSPAGVQNPYYKVKTLLKVPEILIISLDRFTYLIEGDTYRRYKIYNNIPFPVKGLSLKNYLAKPDSQESEFDLYGIVMHHYEGSHYTAYVNVDDQWYFCNDQSVDPVSNDTVETIATTKSTRDRVEIESDLRSMGAAGDRYLTPYILFYKQRRGKKMQFESKNITNAVDLEKRLKSEIPADSLPLPYFEMYLAEYKIDLDSIASGINEGLVTVNYVTDAFLGWLEDKEKSERNNVLKSLNLALSALSARFEQLAL